MRALLACSTRRIVPALPILTLLACGRESDPPPATPPTPPAEEASAELDLPEWKPAPLLAGASKKFEPAPAPPPISLYATHLGENGGTKHMNVPVGTPIRGLSERTRRECRSVAWAREFALAQEIQKLTADARLQKSLGHLDAEAEFLGKRDALLGEDRAGLVSNGATVALIEEGEPFSQVIIPGIPGSVWVPTAHLHVLQGN
jgi:hypothetical protein